MDKVYIKMIMADRVERDTVYPKKKKLDDKENRTYSLSNENSVPWHTEIRKNFREYFIPSCACKISILLFLPIRKLTLLIIAFGDVVIYQ